MDHIKGRGFATAPTFVWKIVDGYEDKKTKHRTKAGSDAIDNLQHLYRLKERGVITEDEFAELKEKVKKHVQ